MIAYFHWRGIEYRVSGWLWASDGASNGLIVSREDGRAIRGAKMHPGMVQTGISGGLSRAATRALRLERAREGAEG